MTQERKYTKNIDLSQAHPLIESITQNPINLSLSIIKELFKRVSDSF